MDRLRTELAGLFLRERAALAAAKETPGNGQIALDRGYQAEAVAYGEPGGDLVPRVASPHPAGTPAAAC